MPDFIFAYHGGKMPDTPEEGEKAMAAWNAWYQDMGDKVVHGGGPVGKSSTVSNSGVAQNGGSNPLSGFTIVKVKDHAEADKLAKGCPILDAGGNVEVAPIIDM